MPATPRTKVSPDRAKREKKQPPYHVILLDDDDHTYEYVVRMLCSLFGLTLERAYQCAEEVDTMGRCVVDTTTLERAELKRDQIHACGPDRRLDRSAGSMTATIEPAAKGWCLTALSTWDS